MEFHYPDLCIPTDHLLTDPYAAEYTPQYLIPNHEAEYEIRSNILVDGGDRFGVSAVVFDKYEELIWMGNQGGHVTSYFGPNMQKFTSFQIHESEEVRDIITVEQGIYAVTKTMLRHQIRRGIPKHTYRSENMADMQCLYQVSSTKLLMGGHQDKLIDLDLIKMKETVIPIQEEGCAILRSGGGSLVACGSANGTVALRDIRCPGIAEHTFKAHTACLSDLDMQGDLLISCGFTQSGSEAVAEPYVVVWDVRRLRAGGTTGEGAWSIPIASPPLLLHFLPVFSGRAVALSGDGHVALLHVNSSSDAEDQSVFQVDTHSSLCSVMDVSSTSQALVFGDQGGHLQLFSPRHNLEPVFNNFSRATEFADQVVDLPYVSFTDTNFQYSSVPLPPLTTGNKWLNELPVEFFRKVFRKPRPLDPEVLKSMKMQGPIGYAPNPRTFKRNQMPYIEDTLEDLNAAKQNDTRYNQPVPKHYQKMDMRYTKHSTAEELASLNRTGFPALEVTLPNSYCNPMLQVLYHTAAVKSTLLAHTCAKEFCLSCELGFLFRMLDTSGGVPCQATNFLRAFRTIPEASALGLILPDRGPDTRVDFIALIQSWNRFILHQMHYEILETRKKEKELAMLAQNASSPPKNRVPPIKISRVNGQFEDYQYTELEFLGPATEFEYRDGEAREDWPGSLGQDDGACDTEVSSSNENHELSSSQQREESDISQLFAIGRHHLNRCLKCNKEEERESVVLACALQYSMGAREGEARGGFIDLVRASLSARRSTPAWCEHCTRFTPTTQRGRIARLPPILAINCGGVSAHEKAYWAKGPLKDLSDPKRGGSGKPCRYGLHCARPGCRFKHPDRSGSSSQLGSSKSPTRESQCVLPLQLVIRQQSDGDIVINDKADQSPTETPINREKQKKKQVSMQSEEEYSLSAAVVCVEDNPKNLIAYIHTAHKESEPQWYLFNDLSIIPVSADEVVQFSAWWKTPCVLFYTAKNVKLRNDEEEARS